MTDLESVLEKVRKLRIWKRRDQNALHKPLLMLYALGQFSQGKETLSFRDVDPALRALLKEFGPRKYIHTEYPFSRLQNDGLWTVTAHEPLESRASNTDAKKSELIQKNAVGAFPEDVKQVLRLDPQNLRMIVSTLLETYFPETLHRDILDSVGLSLNDASGRRSRSPEFRRKVLRAYESRCCVCGYDLRLRDTPAGIEAAHIMWWQAGGPDIESNGLALCTLHHKVFDLGGFTVNADGLTLVFSQEISGETQRDWLLGFHGKSLLRPQSEIYFPDREFLDWHQNTIFKAPGRELTDLTP